MLHFFKFLSFISFFSVFQWSIRISYLLCFLLTTFPLKRPSVEHHATICAGALSQNLVLSTQTAILKQILELLNPSQPRRGREDANRRAYLIVS